jgi:hypothetical protein
MTKSSSSIVPQFQFLEQQETQKTEWPFSPFSLFPVVGCHAYLLTADTGYT